MKHHRADGSRNMVNHFPNHLVLKSAIALVSSGTQRGTMVVKNRLQYSAASIQSRLLAANLWGSIKILSLLWHTNRMKISYHFTDGPGEVGQWIFGDTK
ncbi:MAG TPA: hypothetical protein VFQ47_02795 [Nitrososphaera sp.]|nr:hypothetical protein [Nitrososphaera sp.]